MLGQIAAVSLGVVLILLSLWDSLETVVLPRSLDQKFSFSLLFYRAVDVVYLAMGRSLASKPARREQILGAYGPLTLIGLIAVWLTMLILGFSLVLWGLQVPMKGTTESLSFFDAIYFTSVTILTLGYGDFTPESGLGRTIAILIAATGFGFLALTISYLPVQYSNFSKREAPILLLDARAGSPPSAGELLKRMLSKGPKSVTRLFETFETWATQTLEATISFPILAYFRSQHDQLTWIGAATVMLDAPTLIMATIEPRNEAECDLVKQAELTYAINRHMLVDIAYLLDIAPRPWKTPRWTSAEFAQIHSVLAGQDYNVRPLEEAQANWERLHGEYDAYLHGFERNLFIYIPGISAPKDHPDSWQTTAWDQNHF